MRIQLSVPDLLAYGLSACFIAGGLLVLASGDAHIEASRSIRNSVDIAGDERHLFGALLLAAGYVLLRWVFRRSIAKRSISIERQIVALFALMGYAAYRVGG